MNKYFIYCRKSSEQEDRQVLSLDSQERELSNYARENDLKVVHIYRESGSAHTAGRVQFNEMLRRLEDDEANGVVVWDESRIARNSLDGGRVIYMIDLGQITEIHKPGKIYRNTPDDKSWLGMLFTMSKKDSDDKGVNVKRGLKTKAEKGWLPSGAKPGYMNDKYAEKGNKTIRKDPDRFPLIRQCWDYMLTGAYTPAKILRLLNDEWRYTTPVRKSIGGKPMSRSQIYTMFADPFYYGCFEFPVGSGVLYKGAHEPMVTKAEFDRVQVLIHRPGSPRPKNKEFAHTGLMRCGECSAFITAEEKWQVICPDCDYKFTAVNRTACPKCRKAVEDMDNPTVRHYIYYHCTKRKNPNCTQGSIQEGKLEEQIDAFLAKIGITEEFKRWAIKYLNELNDQETESRTASLHSLQENYNRLQEQLDNLLKLKISSGNTDGSLLSDEEFRSQKERLTMEKDRIKELLDDTDHRSDKWMETAEKAFNFAVHARYWFAHGSPAEKREIMVAIGSNLVFQNKMLRLDLQKPYCYLEEAIKAEPTISQMFEPGKEKVSTAEMEAAWAQNLSMLPR